MAGLVPAIHEFVLRQLPVRAVAIGLVVRSLAAAEPGFFGLYRPEGHRTEPDSFMRAVAERLGGAAPASAPIVILALFDGHAIRRFLCGNWIGHLFSSPENRTRRENSPDGVSA